MAQQLYTNRLGDTFNIDVTNGITTCLIYDELPDHLLGGLIDFLHGHYSALALIVNISNRDHHIYYISQSENNFDFEWATRNLNDLEPGKWLLKSPNVILGDTYLRSGFIIQALEASQKPASEVRDVQVDTQDALPKEARSPLPEWLPLALTSAVSFGLGALFCGLF
jgi:hypothetical protein